jgi:peptidylprolyl isomerase
MRVIQEGDKVQVQYVKRFQDGGVVSSSGKPATELTVGIEHPRLPGLGLALVGLAVGDSRILLVPAQRAYGLYELGRMRRLARTRFATHEDLSVGKWVRVRNRQGQRRLVRVLEACGTTVLVDTNHRWADQSLELEVEVITIHGPEVT